MITVNCLEVVKNTETGPLSLKTFSADNEGEAPEKANSSFSERNSGRGQRMCVKFESLYLRGLCVYPNCLHHRWVLSGPPAVHWAMQRWLLRQGLWILSSPKEGYLWGQHKAWSTPGLWAIFPGFGREELPTPHSSSPPVFFGYVKMGEKLQAQRGRKMANIRKPGGETGDKGPKRHSENGGSPEKGREWGRQIMGLEGERGCGGERSRYRPRTVGAGK